MLNTHRTTPLICALALGTLALGSGCVPASRYDAAKSALDREQAANRRTAARNAELEQALNGVQATLQAEEQRLAEHEQQLSASNLDVEQAASARDNALGVVEQLRGELARAGEHLRVFSEQKQELAKALAQAVARSEGKADAGLTQEHANLIRDIALVFHEQITTGTYELLFSSGNPVLIVPLAGNTAAEPFGKSARKVGAELAQFMSLHDEIQLGLSLDGFAGDAASARMKDVQERLTKAGVPAARMSDQIASQPAEASAKPAAGVLRIAFRAVSLNERTAAVHP